MKKEPFVNRLIKFTERYLTWRKRRRYIKKEKQKKKHPVVDWGEAFLWAAMVVLLVNQYLFQAYQIPSGSMRNTLLEKDRIFVNKLIYGPELIPGRMKIPGFKKPERGEVMIFESPEYVSKGPVFDVFQRIIYMLTLSIVDIDKDKVTKQPKAHFLIKRLILLDGDCYKIDKGEFYIRPKGEDRYYHEEDLKALSGLQYNNHRLYSESEYNVFDLAGEAFAVSMILGQPLDTEHNDAMEMCYDAASGRLEGDRYHIEQVIAANLYQACPQDRGYAAGYYKNHMGRYIPDNWILPLGDNRDNSNDGRYFGPLPKSKVLGRAMFIYWPLFRSGIIR